MVKFKWNEAFRSNLPAGYPGRFSLGIVMKKGLRVGSCEIQVSAASKEFLWKGEYGGVLGSFARIIPRRLFQVFLCWQSILSRWRISWSHAGHNGIFSAMQETSQRAGYLGMSRSRLTQNGYLKHYLTMSDGGMEE
ncbi:hypothetical protein N9F36_08400 [Akkermansiaceae bacterium]|nr:hypothetical protein [Akkermansiaceae bacterium]